MHFLIFLISIPFSFIFQTLYLNKLVDVDTYSISTNKINNINLSNDFHKLDEMQIGLGEYNIDQITNDLLYTRT